MKTQVGIIGAGPAGLVLSHLLHMEGIESVLVECRRQAYVEHRVRAGVLEYGTAKLLAETGVGARMLAEGLRRTGINLLFNGRRHRIDFAALVDKYVTVYPQQEIVKDLVAARIAAGGSVFFDVRNTSIHDIDSANPNIHFEDSSGVQQNIECDFIVGCDGFHGICRQAVPADLLQVYERIYPFAWLGILAEARPASEELIYAQHERGFALLSMRSPRISRLYLQCAPDEDLIRWPDEKIWQELQTRLTCETGFRLEEGLIVQKNMAPVRSLVTEPMQYGRLFLAGDAAHLNPPAGVKGLNLAVADSRTLAYALRDFYRNKNEQSLRNYTKNCLPRVWRAQHFSSWMTSLLHRFEGPYQNFDFHRQTAELELITTSQDAARVLAENYTNACAQ